MDGPSRHYAKGSMVETNTAPYIRVARKQAADIILPCVGRPFLFFHDFFLSRGLTADAAALRHEIITDICLIQRTAEL